MQANRELIGLLAAIEAGAIGEAQWRDWADRAMLEAPQVPAWLLDLSAATQPVAALAALEEGLVQTADSPGDTDRTSVHLGFLRLRHERGEIGLAELLERAGRLTDAANYDEPECEAFYLLLNEIDQGGPTQPSPRPLGERACELFEDHVRFAQVLLEELGLQPAGTGGRGRVNAGTLAGKTRIGDSIASIAVPPRFQGDARSFPYLVSDRGLGPGIAKVSPGRFHIWRDGTMGSVLQTASAILVSRALGGFLAVEAVGGWRAQDVIVLDPPATEIHDYAELVIDDEIGPDSLPSDVSGKRLWRYGANHFFVSPTLMDAIRERFPDVAFSMGFSIFGG